MKTENQSPEAAPSIAGKALLAIARISTWEARRHDKRITEEVNTQHAASRDAGRYHKHLFGGRATLHQTVLNAASRARTAHWENTLPWSDAGWRLLPTTNWEQYTDVMRAARAEFDEALEAFLVEYPSMVEEAREKLNGMFNREDYPSVMELRSKFRIEIEYEPLPISADFRIQLPAAELARVEQEVQGRVQKLTARAMQDAWRQLAETVATLQDRLSEGKQLRDALMERIHRVAEALTRLNVAGDPDLERMRVRVEQELGTLDLEAARKDPKARGEAAAKATEIMAAMEAFYSLKDEEGSEK